MKIIVHANNIYVAEEFEQMILNNPSLRGVSFDITATKDGKIVLFNPAPNNIVSVGSVQNSLSSQLSEFNIKLLETALQEFGNYKKRIILNVLPLYYPPINEDTVGMINQKNLDYVMQIKNVIEDYPFLDLYICSSNQNIVEHMRNNLSPFKIGISLQTGNFNYVDVDFYKIGTPQLDISIINQQLEQKKEVIVFIEDCDDTTLLLRYFYQHPSSGVMKDYVFQNIIFECNYPEIFYLAFRECKTE